jgi:hypothetical protein
MDFHAFPYEIGNCGSAIMNGGLEKGKSLARRGLCLGEPVLRMQLFKPTAAVGYPPGEKDDGDGCGQGPPQGQNHIG